MFCEEMKTSQCNILICSLYLLSYCSYQVLGLNPAVNLLDEIESEAQVIGLDKDKELFEIAFKFLQKIQQTRKSLVGLRELLDYVDSDLLQRAETLESRYVKGKGLWKLLQGTLDQAKLTTERAVMPEEGKIKRMCRVNLGGHCQTENAASLANQMHFLSSGLSPGKRRRRATGSRFMSKNASAARSQLIANTGI